MLKLVYDFYLNDIIKPNNKNKFIYVFWFLLKTMKV